MGHITVLVADPTPILAEALGIALSLHPDFYVLDERPQNGPASVSVITRLKPDVALVDFWMPEIPGPMVTAAVLEQTPSTNVILFSWLCGPKQVTESVEAGAVGLLPKDCPVATVAEVIRRVAAGERPLSAEKHIEGLAGRKERKRDDLKQFLKLTSREVEILALVDKGRTTREISSRLYISPKTVSNHIFEILAKTGTHSQVELLAKARRCGFLKP